MSERNKSEIEEILHKEMIELAGKIPGTEAIYKGHDPGHPNVIAYYFLIPGAFDPDITDSITEVNVSLSRKFPKLSFSLMRWPISQNEAHEYPFLGKRIHSKK